MRSIHLIFVLVVLLVASTAIAQVDSSDGFWIPSDIRLLKSNATPGEVQTIRSIGNTIYISGIFSKVQAPNDTFETPRFVMHDTTWRTLYPSIVGQAYARDIMIIDSILYMGGDNLDANGQGWGLVRYVNGTWERVGYWPPARVYAMEHFKGKNYLAGHFQPWDTAYGYNVAQVDDTSYINIGGLADQQAYVHDLETAKFNGEELLVAGGYNIWFAGWWPDSPYVEVNNMAAYDGVDWININNPSMNTINALHFDSILERLFVTDNRVTSWDGSKWSRDTTFTVNCNTYALMSYHGEIYLGGEFNHIDCIRSSDSVKPVN
ncbi:MAG: hypothetical protein IH946_07815, partial [Bacteroidetes bacterium]|nr:hypothetical protein [Bacteroidota bacterium]